MSISPDIEISARSNLIGAIWMVVAMAGFAVEDAFLKAASINLPVAQVLMMFGAGGVVIFALWAQVLGQRMMPPEVLSKPMRIRAFFEVIGRLFFVLALALTPLSSTTAILQATPIVVVLGAAVVFGEKVGWRRWSAIFVGLVGVLIILKPTGDSFSPLSVLAVLGMLGFAGRDLASRAAPKSLSVQVLGIWGFAAIIFAGALYMGWEQKMLVMPALRELSFLVLACGVGAGAYVALMRAMRTGAVASVTPFRYSRLLFGLGLGVFVFGEDMDQSMLLGSAIVVLSGLFILWRGNRA